MSKIDPLLAEALGWEMCLPLGERYGLMPTPPPQRPGDSAEVYVDRLRRYVEAFSGRVQLRMRLAEPIASD